MINSNFKNRIKSLPPIIYWVAGYAVMLGLCAFLAYYWCVFYEFTQISKPALVGICCIGGTLIYIAIYALSNFVKSFDLRATLAVFLCGLCFVFITPPFQVPDETDHYLRAYSISQGHFDFDGKREYPQDVTSLMSNFSYAWTNAHDGHPIKGDERISSAYEQYFSDVANNKSFEKSTTEPIVVMILPYLPQSAFMALARLFGFKALGVLYAGRIANLAIYALLCYFAFKNCKRYKSVFVAAALLPLSLFMAGSANYDAVIIGLMLFAASYYCVDEITDKSLIVFCAAVALMSAVKMNNILFIILPLVLPARVWKCRLKKWQLAAIAAACALVLMYSFELYANIFRSNYDVIPRQDGNSPMGQLAFIFSNIPRFIAVMLGSLYENSFYIFNLGVFGNLDLNLPLVSGLSVCALLFSSALSAHEKNSLSAKSSAGLFALSVVYAASVLAGLYITYNPLYHIRISGVQARYFIPSFVMLAVLLAGLLSHVLEPRKKAQSSALQLGLSISAFVAVYGAILNAQHYFIGPDYIPK